MSNHLTEAKPTENVISISNLVSKKHKLYHFFNFIEQNYGSDPENILKALTSILDLDKGIRAIFNKKFTFRNSLSLLRYSLPAALYGVEMGLKLTKYIQRVRKGELSEYDKRMIKIKNLLELTPQKDIDRHHRSFINNNILDWLLKGPKTNGYKILGFYNHNTLDKLEKLPNELESVIILFEYHKNKILLNVTIKTFSNMSFIDELFFIGEYALLTEHVKELELCILKDFIMTFNIKENILEFRGSIVTRTRSKVNEVINQFDVQPLISEIKKVLSHGRKRGYAFIGKQGTGKSIIIKKLEEILTDIIIIRINPDEFSSSSSIKRCFNLIRTIQPALVIIEDLDAYRFKEKNERVGTFINEIDDSNNDLNAVILVTINDPDMIHRTIIDRPGRFDEIIEIKSPQTTTEAYDVMKSKYNRLQLSYTDFINIKFPKLDDITDWAAKCVKHKFTQAELTNGVIEKVFINCMNPRQIDFHKEIGEAVNSFETSKRSLKNYSFNEDEEIYDEVPDEDCVKKEEHPRLYFTKEDK